LKLAAPLTEETIRKLRPGEVVHLTGRIFTMRDLAHERILQFIREGRKLPFNLKDGVIYHCGPIMRRKDDGWEVISAGPTTSARMNRVEAEVIEQTGVRAIIGKGGMNGEVGEAMKEKGCVYLAFTGGAAVVAALRIKEVVDVHWLDLGMAEAVWELDVRDFGPLIAAMDANGNSIYRDVGRLVEEKRKAIESAWEWKKGDGE